MPVALNRWGVPIRLGPPEAWRRRVATALRVLWLGWPASLVAACDLYVRTPAQVLAEADRPEARWWPADEARCAWLRQVLRWANRHRHGRPMRDPPTDPDGPF